MLRPQLSLRLEKRQKNDGESKKSFGRRKMRLKMTGKENIFAGLNIVSVAEFEGQVKE
ncbi:MAG: hypothetical protein LBH06_01030 [Rikenellaceae bacterium]|nr:hypothetical protein [Rikenellaceae bacterium]